MKATADQPKAPESKPESKPKTPESKLGPKPNAPDPKDDLKTLPLPEVEKKLGSSAKGLSQAEVQKRLAQYGPNEIAEKKTNVFLKFLSYFWGPIPWMIEGAVILSGVVRHWMDFFIILFLLFSNAVVAFWEEHQAGNEIDGLEGQACDQGQSAARWKVDRTEGIGTGARRRDPSAAGRHRAGRCASAGGRSNSGRSVRVNRRIFARQGQAGRSGVFGFDYQAGRNRRNGLCHRHKHLLWQDRATGAAARIQSAISSEPC